jgi:hypothetical protein
MYAYSVGFKFKALGIQLRQHWASVTSFWRYTLGETIFSQWCGSRFSDSRCGSRLLENLDPDPDPDQDPDFLWPKMQNFIEEEKKLKNFWYFILRPPWRASRLQEKPPAPDWENRELQNMETINFFVGNFCLPGWDLDLQTQWNPDPIRIADLYLVFNTTVNRYGRFGLGEKGTFKIFIGKHERNV